MDRVGRSGKRHAEGHRLGRLGWLRAAVLGANDGIVSTSSLIVGMAAANAPSRVILLAGAAGLVAGALSMAAGEYVSVHSQADGERADLERERAELESDPQAELRELAGIYVARGLEPALARQVAEQLTRKDALGAHARDELGLSEMQAAKPLQAALASAASFAAGAMLPMMVVQSSGRSDAIVAVGATSTLFLALLGAMAAKVAGAPVWSGVCRVTAWGVIAMAVTAGIGLVVGV